jgi:hypothetical protein
MSAVLRLVHPGPRKIATIREVKTVTGLLLVDAKHFVDRFPSTFDTQKLKVPLREAAALLIAAGAKIEMSDPGPLDKLTAASFASDAVDALGEGDLDRARKALRAALELIGDVR